MEQEPIIRDILNSVGDIKSELEKIQNSLNDIKNDIIQGKSHISIDKQFSVLNLPSEGKFYLNKKSFLLVRYLTSAEENILMDPMLMESGIGLELALKSLIIDDIEPYDLLLSDFQAILIFLRSTAYGDIIQLKFKCPSCKRESDFDLHLSRVKFKEHKDEADSNGEFDLILPKSKYEVKIKPITFGKQLKARKESDSDKLIYTDEMGKPQEIRKENTIKLLSYIKSINGVEDREKIKKAIKSLPKVDSGVLGDFISRNESGIDNNVKCQCEFCSAETEQAIDFGYNLLSLPDTYQKHMLEEEFLITYYGKGITMDDAMKMPVFKRRWHINRISEEITKQNEAEKAAAQRAKSKK